MKIELILPYPPSLNHYWRRVGSRTLLSRAGREYRERLIGIVRSQGLPPMEGWLECWIAAFPPDRRRRDVDNLLKALLDGLEHSGLYANDYQIESLHIKRCAPKRPHGEVVVTIEEMRE